MRRGEIWWASLPEPNGSGPGYRRPVVVVQSDDFNRSRIQTIIGAAITSNTRLAAAPGNFLVRRRSTRLQRDSVVNVSQLITIDKSLVTDRIGRLPPRELERFNEGLRLVLAL
ncbi:MAG: type II toxin-antitoxin system PemK/MazF family toxin [Candidatus Binataceae bacterium]